MFFFQGAYESQGLFKQALTDVQQVNRSDAATTESKENEKRLKEIVAGRRAPGMLELLYEISPTFKTMFAGSPGGRNVGGRVPPLVYFTAKCTYEEETRCGLFVICFCD